MVIFEKIEFIRPNHSEDYTAEVFLAKECEILIAMKGSKLYRKSLKTLKLRDSQKYSMFVIRKDPERVNGAFIKLVTNEDLEDYSKKVLQRLYISDYDGLGEDTKK